MALNHLGLGRVQFSGKFQPFNCHQMSARHLPNGYNAAVDGVITNLIAIGLPHQHSAGAAIT